MKTVHGFRILQAPGKQALAIGQVAASAVRMCGHARQAPALRLLAQELGVLLSEPRTRPV